MISSNCKVRSCLPVPLTVPSRCPEPPPKVGGCPTSAIQRCGQYQKDPCPDTTCKLLVPPFYETEKMRKQQEAKLASCRLTLPIPAPDKCGMICAPLSEHHAVDDHHSRGNKRPATPCHHTVMKEKSSKSGQKQDFFHAPDETHLSSKDDTAIDQICHSGCAPKVPPCLQKSLSATPPNDACGESHSSANDNFKGNEIGCYGYKKSEVDSPGHSIHSKSTEKNKPDGFKSKIPPCWQDMFDVAPKRPEECPSIPRHKCDKRDEDTRPAVDNRGALRPDIRDCPALGRNFCVHEPAPPLKQHEEMPSECENTAIRLLSNIDSFKTHGKNASQNRHYCVPPNYNDAYCGRSGTNFPMYCAASSGLQVPPPDCAEKKKKKSGPSHCPATEPCCRQLPTTFIVDRDSCYGQQCISSEPPDRDVARRVGGFQPNMPSPTTWI